MYLGIGFNNSFKNNSNDGGGGGGFYKTIIPSQPQECAYVRTYVQIG